MELMKDPKFREFIEHFTNLMQQTHSLSFDEVRKKITEFFAPATLPREPIYQIRDLTITATEGHEIPIRIYTPNNSHNLNVFTYYHRGGWVFCNIVEADAVCRKLANHMNCVVVSVDYRLAPENPFPKPLDDCYDAFCWVSQHLEELSNGQGKHIVGGESAGGNLAAAVALRARDFHGPKADLQLLIYPIISSTLNDEVYATCLDQHFLTKQAMQFFWGCYLQNLPATDLTYASVDRAADVSRLPPAVVITGEHDPLRIEAEAYAKMLILAGNQVTMEMVPSVVHGFLDLPCYDDEQKVRWIQKIAQMIEKN